MLWKKQCKRYIYKHEFRRNLINLVLDFVCSPRQYVTPSSPNWVPPIHRAEKTEFNNWTNIY